MSVLLIALGAAVGAPLRYLADRAVRSRLDTRFPWGTLTVNVVGSLVLGVVLAVPADPAVTALVATGFCGALTTYSAVAVQSANRGGLAGTAYAVGTVLGCLAVAWAGYTLG